MIECSKKRGNQNRLIFQKCETVKMHVSCHKSYTREKNVVAAMKVSGSAVWKVVRLSKPIFEFKTKCLFCAEDAFEDFHS